MHPRCASKVCEQVIRDAYDKRFTKIKVGETYALSVKTGQSGLKNWNIHLSLK
jgi:hypothetical protein